jgi:hypothetical protein
MAWLAGLGAVGMELGSGFLNVFWFAARQSMALNASCRRAGSGAERKNLVNNPVWGID